MLLKYMIHGINMDFPHVTMNIEHDIAGYMWTIRLGELWLLIILLVLLMVEVCYELMVWYKHDLKLLVIMVEENVDIVYDCTLIKWFDGNLWKPAWSWVVTNGLDRKRVHEMNHGKSWYETIVLVRIKFGYVGSSLILLRHYV